MCIKRWYEFPVLNPDGTKDGPVLVLGEGETEAEAYLNADSKARIAAAVRDEIDNFPPGVSRTLGQGKKCHWPYGILIVTYEDGIEVITNMETGETKTWFPDSAASLQ
ncbi:MAG: hypothetical protein HYT98_01975 [Candidatus Sungbacteria bacterium]|nr:hypothetical protein [Candidatus Sungbacteria bacterium]